MKRGNIALVFLLSCLVGSQVMDRMKLPVVVWIVSGCNMAVAGEIHFALLGFLIQAGSQLGESGKNILQKWIMSGSDIKLDPLTYHLFMAPSCLVVLTIGCVFTWDSRIIPQIALWWPHLLANALITFSLNVTISLLIKQTSAMGFVLSGIVKDVVIVMASAHIFGTPVQLSQVCGFSVATTGMLFWALMKLQPDSAPVRGLAKVLSLPCATEEGFVEEREMLLSHSESSASNFACTFHQCSLSHKNT